MKEIKKGIVFLFLLVFSLIFCGGTVYRPFFSFSMARLESLFSSEKMREVFCVSREEAVEVFGEKGEEVFL